MCGILAVLGCSDDSQAKRVRVLELSRRQIPHSFLFTLFFAPYFQMSFLLLLLLLYLFYFSRILCDDFNQNPLMVTNVIEQW